MLKVVAVVDKTGTAIDRLAQGLKPFFTNLDYKVVDCHPKRPDAAQLATIEAECRDADLISFDYFRTAEMLRERLPWLKEKKSILQHYNPYSITEKDWDDYDLVLGCNQDIYKRLGEITHAPVEYMPLTVDTSFWTYNPDWRADSTAVMNVLMVANRIESKKGVLPVAEACKKLGMNLDLVGAVSDAEYFSKVIATGVVRFHEQISDEDLKKLYYKATVHICNSVDGYESGTLPLLEAMLCGTPVITRNVGHVPDLNNGENMVINDHEPDDAEHLVELIYNLVSDKKKMEAQRDKAWNSAKVRSNERRAYMLQKMYRQVLHPEEVPVSIVVPVYDKPDIIRKCLDAVSKQTYKNIELIVCDDSLGVENQQIVRDFAQYVNFPVRFIKSAQVITDMNHEGGGYKDYGLARARNMGTIEATGDIMIYCDQRMIMEEDCVEEFVKYSKSRHWLYANKGVDRPFIENVSSLYRTDIIRFGMFSERGTEYGFQSQYCRAVAREQALKTEECKSARVVPTGKSSNRNRKRQDILTAKNKLFKMGLD